jgi:tetratricopeptide (TPR) repeat protein/transcriptional regulator with XRE-family HTH domain
MTDNTRSVAAADAPLAVLIRELRARRLITQEELAEQAGLSVGTVRGLESGRIGRPRSASVRALVEALAVSDDERRRLIAVAHGPAPTATSPAPGRSGESGVGLPGAGGPPRQLPREVSWFTGRTAELEQLLELMPDPEQASAVVITAIDGMAGIGKTALAVYAAHRMVDRFPDGQLFIDLHGYTRGLAPVEPAEALDRLLRDLGVPGTAIPTGVDERAALYRTRLADRQALIVLDNAATEAQVAPLLPGTAGCLVLVTSRRRLAGLDHTHTVSLDTLPVADAITLFTQIAGEGRLADQPAELVAELVKLCGWLPLAIRIAAARLRSRPAWQLRDLVRRLRDRQHRLGELEAGQRSVTAALDLSYQHLDPDQQQAYRLLGLHPGPEFDVHATAALLDSPLQHAGRMLDQLLDAHLLQEPTPGRYRFHDLTRAHAAADDPTAPTPDAALGRLLDYYRHTASAAMDNAYPYERQHRPQVPPAHTPAPQMPDPTAALDWLDTELPNLLAAARSAPEHDRPRHLLDLSTILHRHLRTRGRYHDAENLHQQALATTASAAGDQTGRLSPLNSLGDIHWRQGRYEQAADHYQQALRIARATGNRSGELYALTGLGDIDVMQGRYGQAVDHYEQALRIARATGHRPAELNALAGLGDVHRFQGRIGQAVDHFEEALRIARAIGDRSGEMTALTGLGYVHRHKGRYEPAADHYRQALRIARAIGDRTGELYALTGLGDLHLLQRRYEPAADYFEQALRIARATGNRSGELNALIGLGNVNRLLGQYEHAAGHYQQLLDLAQASGDRNYEFEAWQGLGRLQHATGHPDAAIAHHERALTLAGQLSQPSDQARAHDGLAHAHHTLHQHKQARQHWQHALNLLTQLGTDYTDDEETTTTAIRAHLTSLTQHESTPIDTN